MSEEKNTKQAFTATLVGQLDYHTDQVTSLAVPIYDVGYDLITASRDKKVVGWKIEPNANEEAGVQGVPKKLFITHSHIVEECKLSHKNSYIITASWDRTARIIDISEKDKTVLLQGHKNDVLTASISSGVNPWVVTGSRDGTICIWSVDGKLVGQRKISDDSAVTSAIFASTDTLGGVIVVGTSDTLLQVYRQSNTLDLLMSFEGHTREITTIVESPCPFIVASGDSDGNVILWNLESGQADAVCKVDGEVHDITIHHAKKWIAISAGHTVYLWDLDTSSTSNSAYILTPLVDSNTFFNKKHTFFGSLKWAVDGSHLFAGAYNGTTYIWNVAQPQDAKSNPVE